VFLLRGKQLSDKQQVTGGIYAIKNVVSGAWYIGSTYDFEYRFSDHRRKLRSGNHDWLDKAFLDGITLYNKQLIAQRPAYVGKSYPAFTNIYTGEEIPSGNNLYRYCKENGLSQSGLNRVISGRWKSWKGWVLRDYCLCPICNDPENTFDTEDIVCKSCLGKIMKRHGIISSTQNRRET
jgi:hypothetical protein